MVRNSFSWMVQVPRGFYGMSAWSPGQNNIERVQDRREKGKGKKKRDKKRKVGGRKKKRRCTVCPSKMGGRGTTGEGLSITEDLVLARKGGGTCLGASGTPVKTLSKALQEVMLTKLSSC